MRGTLQVFILLSSVVLCSNALASVNDDRLPPAKGDHLGKQDKEISRLKKSNELLKLRVEAKKYLNDLDGTEFPELIGVYSNDVISIAEVASQSTSYLVGKGDFLGKWEILDIDSSCLKLKNKRSVKELCY